MIGDADLIARSSPADFTHALVANLTTTSAERHVWLWARDGETIAAVMHVFHDLEPRIMVKTDGAWSEQASGA